LIGYYTESVSVESPRT